MRIAARAGIVLVPAVKCVRAVCAWRHPIAGMGIAMGQKIAVRAAIAAVPAARSVMPARAKHPGVETASQVPVNSVITVMHPMGYRALRRWEGTANTVQLFARLFMSMGTQGEALADIQAGIPALSKERRLKSDGFY